MKPETEIEHRCKEVKKWIFHELTALSLELKVGVTSVAMDCVACAKHSPGPRAGGPIRAGLIFLTLITCTVIALVT